MTKSYFNGDIITKEMVYQHAKEHDDNILGPIILSAIGVRGSCIGFCVNKHPIYANGRFYNLFWTRDGNDYGETFSEDDIMRFLKRVKVTVTVERKERR